MTLPQKGSRLINLHGVDYRWAIRKKPTYSEGIGESNLTAAVELKNSPKSTLLITFNKLRSDSWVSLENVSATPKKIVECIEKALLEGWQPDVSGQNFQVECELT